MKHPLEVADRHIADINARTARLLCQRRITPEQFDAAREAGKLYKRVLIAQLAIQPQPQPQLAGG